MGLQKQILSSPSRWRRAALTSTLLVLFAWAAPENVRAGTPQVDAEFGHYGGTSSGTFQSTGCASAPAARMYYEGLGGRVGLRPSQVEAKPVGSGLRNPLGRVVEVAGAVQYERYALLKTGATPEVDEIPEPTLRGAVGLRAGYDWRSFGLRGGAILYQQFGELDVEGCLSPDSCPQYPAPAIKFFPDIAFRLGPREPFHVDVGLGAYNLPTLLQPGLYCGLGAGVSGWKFDLHLGNHNTFHGRYSVVSIWVWASRCHRRCGS